MKLLFYGINYSPELTGIGKYTGEMATYYAQQGHEVEVICAPPYYPAWEVSQTYRGRGWVVEQIDGVTVHRCPLYVPKRVTGVKRILHEASFLLSSLRYWIPRYFRSYDAVVCISPPFHLGFPALLHKWLRGTPVINHVQDLQVDAARDLKLLSSTTLLNVLESLEKFLLRRMTAVSSISSGMLQRLQAKGLPANKLVFFPNWVDSELVHPVGPTGHLRQEWGYTATDKIILYSGNLGEKQGLQILPEVAARFQDNPEVKFLIIGQGGIKEQLVAAVQDRGLTNVRFLPLQPLEKLAATLATADVHLVLQKRAAADLVLPSKLTNILAVGGHALITAEPGCTLYDVALEHSLGTIVEPENATAIEQGLRDILSGQRGEDASGATEYARKYLDKTRILNDFLAALRRIGTTSVNPTRTSRTNQTTTTTP